MNVESSDWGCSFVPPRKVLAVNTGSDHHFSHEVWENFALNKLSEQECVPLEEHLLICAACQDLLAQIDEYIDVVKTATALLQPPPAQPEKPVTDSETRRRISKKTARATSA